MNQKVCVLVWTGSFRNLLMGETGLFSSSIYSCNWCNWGRKNIDVETISSGNSFNILVPCFSKLLTWPLPWSAVSVEFQQRTTKWQKKMIFPYLWSFRNRMQNNGKILCYQLWVFFSVCWFVVTFPAENQNPYNRRRNLKKKKRLILNNTALNSKFQLYLNSLIL